MTFKQEIQEIPTVTGSCPPGLSGPWSSVWSASSVIYPYLNIHILVQIYIHIYMYVYKRNNPKTSCPLWCKELQFQASAALTPSAGPLVCKQCASQRPQWPRVSRAHWGEPRHQGRLSRWLIKVSLSLLIFTGSSYSGPGRPWQVLVYSLGPKGRGSHPRLFRRAGGVRPWTKVSLSVLIFSAVFPLYSQSLTW